MPQGNITTTGRLILNEILPKDVQGFDLLDKKGVTSLYAELAEKYPEQYVDLMQKLNDESREAATAYGREASLGIRDFRLPESIRQKREQLRLQIHEITQHTDLTPEQKNAEIVKIMTAVGDELRKQTVEDSNTAGSSVGVAAKRGFRGNDVQATQLLVGDLLVADQKGRAIPVAGLHGYAEGVTPAEYWAGSYGARKGAWDVQFATAQGGYIGKMLTLMVHRQVVTADDCGAKNTGIIVEGGDSDNIGTVLARDVAGIPSGTVLSKKHIEKLNGKNIRVRSLATCQLPEGVCKLCSGKREKGNFPAIGDYVGITSARSVSEPIVQAALCLFEDTEVRMADFTTKKIKDIQVGDLVLGSDKNGLTSPARVLNVYNNGLRECNKYVFKFYTDYELTSVVCTEDHIFLTLPHFLVVTSQTPIKNIKAHSLVIAATDGKKDFVFFEKVEKESLGLLPTYDIEVDNPDHLFVLANGIVSHNSSKHTGGTIGVNSRRTTGLQEINQFMQVPESFAGGSVLSPVDGRVIQITPAPQGGNYIMVGDKQVYANSDLTPSVKVGDKLEAGDSLTDGTPNPAEIAKHKGLGGGRRFFITKFAEILKDNGIPAHRRHIESLARGFFDRVVIKNPEGFMGYSSGDIVPYTVLQKDYVPRRGTYKSDPKKAINRYLEQPVLHYTIGTRITPSVANTIKDEGIPEIRVHDKEPDFEPEVIRMMTITSTDPDWKTKLSGFYIKKGLLESAQKGSFSPKDSTSYVGKLANPTLL
jgi:DNA-directed RNA polymerase subunit beta'